VHVRCKLWGLHAVPCALVSPASPVLSCCYVSTQGRLLRPKGLDRTLEQQSILHKLDERGEVLQVPVPCKP